MMKLYSFIIYKTLWEKLKFSFRIIKDIKNLKKFTKSLQVSRFHLKWPKEQTKLESQENMEQDMVLL